MFRKFINRENAELFCKKNNGEILSLSHVELGRKFWVVAHSTGNEITTLEDYESYWKSFPNTDSRNYMIQDLTTRLVFLNDESGYIPKDVKKKIAEFLLESCMGLAYLCNHGVKLSLDTNCRLSFIVDGSYNGLFDTCTLIDHSISTIKCDIEKRYFRGYDMTYDYIVFYVNLDNPPIKT